MAYKKAEYLLQGEEFSNYRRIRAIAVVFVFFSLFILWCGYHLLANRDIQERDYSGYDIALIVWGILGLMGAIALFFGNRKFAVFMYCGTVPFLIAFPIGTLLSMLTLRGLSAYLLSIEKLQNDPTAQFDHQIKQRNS